MSHVDQGKLGFSSDEAFLEVFGDDPVADVEGARRAGMQPVWLNRGGARAWPPELRPPALTISSLAEVP